MVFNIVTMLKFNLIYLMVYSQESNLTFPSSLLSTLKTLFNFDPNDVGLDPYEETKNLGYPALNHYVTTADGYILTVLQIPHGKYQEYAYSKRPVVYLVPGFLGTAACFTDNIATSNHALAYSLADAGYDVWILNARGTTFSRGHVVYNSLTDERFWDFGWHEIGTIDIPTTIDYILELTNQKELNVVGYSQGTTSLLVMLSEKPEYNEKVKVLFALAPMAFLENVNPGLKLLSANYKKLHIILSSLQIFNIFPHNNALSGPIMATCNYESNQVQLALCETIIESIAGHPQETIDPRDLHHITSHFPGGASVQQAVHYAQLINYGGFNKYDYGHYKNLEVYGQISPPSYKLENVQKRIYLIYGDGDVIADKQDVLNLYKHLPNAQLWRVNYTLWSHLDFLYAKNVYNILYKDILEILNR
ncbi:lipase 3-like [Chrysoperla carnea]|uniref:lipase 3-like n=1 Tax=Chrysoperla carnea TaxID=189513 RepID=UPI001D06B096|nr:lipase 3-like [Chrysoperla carnea]